MLIHVLTFKAYSQNHEAKAITENKADIELLKYYDSLSSVHLRKAPEKSIEYGKLAVVLAQELHERELEAKITKRNGYANYLLGNYTLCLEHYKQAVKLSKLVNDNFEVAIILNLMGDLHTRQGSYNQAMSCFVNAEKLADSIKVTETDTVSINRFYAMLYTNSGLLHHAMTSLEKAHDCFNKALGFALSIADSNRMAASYSNIGMIYKARSDFDSAFTSYNRALAIASKIGNTRYQTATLNNIASIYLQKHQTDSAMHYYLKARDLITLSGDKYGLSLVNRNMAIVCMNRNMATEAITYLNEAVAIAVEIGSQSAISNSYRELSKAHKQLGNYKDALKFHELYFMYNDSVTGEETRKKVAELEIQYETEKKENENLALRKDKELNQLKISKKNRAIATLLAGIVFVLISFFIILLLYKARYLAFRNLVRKNIEILSVENELESTRKLLDQLQQTQVSVPDDEETELSSEKELALALNTFMKNEKPYFVCNITIDEISSKLNSNRTYLANAIKSEFGHSFNSYINEARVKEAIRLLLSTKYDNHTIEGIGQRVGFNNRISFNANFKKVTGVSPSVFRERR